MSAGKQARAGVVEHLEKVLIISLITAAQSRVESSDRDGCRGRRPWHRGTTRMGERELALPTSVPRRQNSSNHQQYGRSNSQSTPRRAPGGNREPLRRDWTKRPQVFLEPAGFLVLRWLIHRHKESSGRMAVRSFCSP